MTTVEIRLLGHVDVRVDDLPCDLGPKRHRAVFAALALGGGRPVPDHTLIERIWPDARPPGARDTLGSYVTHLRRRLEAAGVPAEITRSSGGYALVTENDAIDVHRFRHLWRQARAICDSGGERRAADLLHEAEALWREPPLADLPPDGWFAGMRVRLAEEHRAARRLRIEAELRLGLHRELIGELTGLFARLPRDEEIAAALMIALYRSNRQSDALAAYHGLRDRLREESGLDPGADLQELYAQILRHDTALAVTPVHRRIDLPAQPNNLPRAPARFTGRAGEIAALTEPRDPGDGAAVQVIEGMAGCGKTALALVAGHRMAGRYPDAQLYLSLAGGDPARPPLTPDDAITRLLHLLGVPPTRIPQSPAEREALWHEEMATRRALLVLDDAADADQVGPLLPAGHPCLTLVTSRARLPDLAPRARVIRLGPLPPHESAELFARIAGPDRTPGAATLTGILDRCGHLPLMIQISASQAGRDTPAAGSPAAPAETGADAADPAGRAVRRALDASYERLDPPVRRAYRLLGAQPCPTITIEAASALLGVPAAAAEPLVRTLFGQHLLESAGDGRFSFHDLLHAHAREHAHAEDRERDLRRAIHRLVTFYRDGAEARGGAPDPRSAAWLDAEWRNVLHVAEYAAAHEWQRACAAMTHAIAEYLDTRGLWPDARRAHERAVRAGRDIDDPRATASALVDLGYAHFRTGDIGAAIAAASDALALYQRLDGERDQARALDLIGVAHWARAHYREAAAYLRESYAVSDAIADDRGRADALSHLAVTSWHLGRYAESIAGLRDALAIYRRTGDKRGEAKTLNNIGNVYQHRGLHRDAYLHYQGSLEIFTEIAGAQNHAILVNNLGNVHQYKGEFAQALRCYRTAIATYRFAGDRRSEADTLNNIGRTYHQMNQHSEALVHHESARVIAEETTDSYELTRAYIGLGDAHRGDRGEAQALRDYHEALKLARSTGDIYHEARAHNGIAELELHRTGAQEARIHWRTALDIYEHLDLPEATAVRIRLQVQRDTEA